MRPHADFQVFLGIDQTGAVIPGSGGLRARPLPWAALLIGNDAPRLLLPSSRLKRFHLEEIESGLHSMEIRLNRAEDAVAVLLDCVLGLPGESVRWDDALAELQRLPEKFGRAPAGQFFSSLLGKQRSIPTRLCEEWAGANSVFRDKPYQKNIQTGTFRLWRDLVTDPRRGEWSIWPHSSPRSPEPGRFTLFEGYPSLMWRHVARRSSRDPKFLSSWLKSQGIRFSRADSLRFSTDADVADSVMLAASGWVLHRSRKLLEPYPGFFESEAFRLRGKREGWIAGLSAPLDDEA
jgi:hypothetical protein